MSRIQRPEVRREGGFTFVEMVIVIALVGIMALWGVPALLNTLNRAKLVGAAREAATLIQVARLEAIKKGGINGDLRNRTSVVLYTNTERSLQVLVDESPDGVWNPVTPIGGLYHLPKGIHLQAPTEAAEGAKAIVGWDDHGDADDFSGPIFLSDGSALRTGAFRLADERENYLEVRIDFPATGKVVTQKWFGGADPDANWWENGESAHHWQW